MSSEVAVPDPPYSTDLLADLHADVLPPEVAAALWPRVRRDPDAGRVLAALDATTAALHDLGADESYGAPIPADVLARLDTTFTPVNDLAARRRKRWLIGGGAVTGIAAAAAVVFALTAVDEPGPATPQAQFEIGRDLPADALLTALGQNNPGDLADPDVLASCLAANGLAPTAPILGSAPIRFDGADAVLLLTTGREPAQVRALIVGTGCSAEDPQTLADKEIG